MKILISHDSGAHLYDRLGFQKVLQYSGHECVVWQLNQKSAFDIFSEFEPDIFLTQLHNIDRATLKCILARPNLLVAAKAGHFGKVNNDVDPIKYPVLVASDDHKRIAETLVKSGNLKFVHVHYHPNSIEYTMGDWHNIVNPIGIMNAFDTFQYMNGEIRDEFKADISMVSGYWAYKAQNLDRYIIPLTSPVGKFNLKIYGTNWPLVQSLGRISEENVKHIFKSTKINLDVHEPHHIFNFDITERIMKVCGAGGFYLSGGYVGSVHSDLFSDGLIKYANNPKEFEEMIQEWLILDKERDIIAKETQYRILNEHTYWERVAQMFYEFGLIEQVDKIILKKQEFLKKIS